MATQLGKFQLFALEGGTLVTTLAGYVSPSMSGLQVSDESPSHIELKDSGGLVVGMIYILDDIVKCTFTLEPRGTSAANAKLAAGLPVIGTAVTLSGLPIITICSLTDVFNSALWIYEGGGTIDAPGDNKWTMTMPLVRRKGITSTTPIS